MRVLVMADERVKTDRDDVEKRARCCRGGDRTAMWVRDVVHEPLRDLVCARVVAKRDQLRARQWYGKFLLCGVRCTRERMAAWTGRYPLWVELQRYKTRHDGAYEAIIAVVWRVWRRLHQRYRALMARANGKQKVITVLGRELVGIITAISCEIERAQIEEVRCAT